MEGLGAGISPPEYGGVGAASAEGGAVGMEGWEKPLLREARLVDTAACVPPLLGTDLSLKWGL